MKVGDYVRIKGLGIGKIKSFDDLDMIAYTDNGLYFGIKRDGTGFAEDSEGYVEKISSNIIDLIEIGDYVNGSYIYSIFEENKNTGQPRVLFTEEDGVLGSGEIKSIVTKEAFEQMEYRIGE